MAENYDVKVKYSADASEVVAASAKSQQAVEGFTSAAAKANADTAKAAAQLTTAERTLAAQIIAAAEAAKAKAAALGLTTTQLRAMERATAQAAAQTAKLAEESKKSEVATVQVAAATANFTAAEKKMIASTLAAEQALKVKAAAAGTTVAMMRKVQTSMAASAVGADALAGSTRKGVSAFQALAIQLPDVAVQLQAGQNPMQILLQQGSQVADQLGLMGEAAKLVGRAVPIMAIAIAAAATAYAVFANAAEDASAATRLLDDRLVGITATAKGARSRLAGLSDETKRFYELVEAAKTSAAKATGELADEDARYAEEVGELRATIEPTIVAQEQLKAALIAENQILREQQKALGTDIAARDELGARINRNRTQIQTATKEIEKHRAAIDEGTAAIGITIAADVAEEEATKRATAARKAATASRDAERQAMVEQQWAQNQLNTAFDYEVDRLTTRAQMLPELQSKLLGMTDAEIAYRAELEKIAEAELQGAITAEEAKGLRAAAAKEWAKTEQDALAKVREAEQKAIKEQHDEHLERLRQQEAERQAYLANAQSILGFTSDALAALASLTDETIAAGEKAHGRLQDLRQELREEREKDIADMDAAEQAEHEANIARLQAQIAMTRERTKTDRQAATKAAKYAKAAAIADIVLKTGQAIMAGIAQFGPPPSPLGIAAIASAGIVGAAQLAVAAGVQVPSYHVGGTKPGDVLSVHLPGETTLNAAASRQLGPEGLRQLQMGNPPAAQPARFQIGRLEVREMERIGLRSGGLYAGAIRTASTSSGPARGISGRGVIS